MVMRRTFGLLAIFLLACSGGGSFIPPPRDMAMGGGPDGMNNNCGMLGQPCCANQTCSGGTSCMNNMCVGNNCGHIGQACCNGNCSDLNSTCMNGQCVMTPMMCGNLNEPCCNGTSCNNGLMCSNGSCIMPIQNCGTVGLPCCQGTCSDGSNCVNGTCTQQGPMNPVGHTCVQPSDCTGTGAICYNTIPTYNIQAPGGYCSNSNCVNDNSCGTGGFCDTMTSHLCFELCAAKGDCAANNPNNLCFNFDGMHDACLPKGISKCDPTQVGTCNGTGACERSGPDNVGVCMTTCMLGVACPNDAQGNAQVCVFYNETVDGAGNKTQDTFAGLACLPTNGNLGANAACMYINDCTSGYECDFFMASGTKTCKQLCKLGTTVCSTGTCKNAFKLNSFVNGSYGLCF
jgi:hypothetical protein